MFKLTEGWLREYYGSLQNQIDDTRQWLIKYGVNVPPEKLDEWSNFKHLAEYQTNTNDIVDRCLVAAETGMEFETELQAHRMINVLRIPRTVAYEAALAMVQPKLILELGVGGDSAISTAIFLAYVEKIGGQLDSIDKNPLGMTWKRYSPFTDLWTFTLGDSLKILSMCADKGIRYDLIFLDTSHSYIPTIAEIFFASKVTDNILLDDALFEGNPDDTEPGGVKRAIEDWLRNYPKWKKSSSGDGTVVLLTKR